MDGGKNDIQALRGSTWDVFFEQIDKNRPKNESKSSAYSVSPTRKNHLAVATLPFKKAACYGSCPTVETGSLRVVKCNDCKLIVKEVGFGHHMRLRHGYRPSSSSGSTSGEDPDDCQDFLLSPPHVPLIASTSSAFSAENMSVGENGEDVSPLMLKIPGGRGIVSGSGQICSPPYYVEQCKDLVMVLSKRNTSVSLKKNENATLEKKPLAKLPVKRRKKRATVGGRKRRQSKVSPIPAVSEIELDPTTNFTLNSGGGKDAETLLQEAALKIVHRMMAPADKTNEPEQNLRVCRSGLVNGQRRGGLTTRGGRGGGGGILNKNLSSRGTDAKLQNGDDSNYKEFKAQITPDSGIENVTPVTQPVRRLKTRGIRKITPGGGGVERVDSNPRMENALLLETQVESTLTKLLKFPGLSVTALTADGKRSPLKQFLALAETSATSPLNCTELHSKIKHQLASENYNAEFRKRKLRELDEKNLLLKSPTKLKSRNAGLQSVVERTRNGSSMHFHPTCSISLSPSSDSNYSSSSVSDSPSGNTQEAGIELHSGKNSAMDEASAKIRSIFRPASLLRNIPTNVASSSSSSSLDNLQNGNQKLVGYEESQTMRNATSTVVPFFSKSGSQAASSSLERDGDGYAYQMAYLAQQKQSMARTNGGNKVLKLPPITGGTRFVPVNSTISGASSVQPTTYSQAAFTSFDNSSKFAGGPVENSSYYSSTKGIAVSIPLSASPTLISATESLAGKFEESNLQSNNGGIRSRGGLGPTSNIYNQQQLSAGSAVFRKLQPKPTGNLARNSLNFMEASENQAKNPHQHLNYLNDTATSVSNCPTENSNGIRRIGSLQHQQNVKLQLQQFAPLQMTPSMDSNNEQHQQRYVMLKANGHATQTGGGKVYRQTAIKSNLVSAASDLNHTRSLYTPENNDQPSPSSPQMRTLQQMLNKQNFNNVPRVAATKKRVFNSAIGPGASVRAQHFNTSTTSMPVSQMDLVKKFRPIVPRQSSMQPQSLVASINMPQRSLQQPLPGGATMVSGTKGIQRPHPVKQGTYYGNSAQSYLNSSMQKMYAAQSKASGLMQQQQQQYHYVRSQNVHILNNNNMNNNMSMSLNPTTNDIYSQNLPQNETKLIEKVQQNSTLPNSIVYGTTSLRLQQVGAMFPQQTQMPLNHRKVSPVDMDYRQPQHVYAQQQNPQRVVNNGMIYFNNNTNSNLNGHLFRNGDGDGEHEELNTNHHNHFQTIEPPPVLEAEGQLSYAFLDSSASSSAATAYSTQHQQKQPHHQYQPNQPSSSSSSSSAWK